jgi:zinc and cadmium transporter
LSFGVLARYTQHMLSLAAGALLATAFMHLLPTARGIRPPLPTAH